MAKMFSSQGKTAKSKELNYRNINKLQTKDVYWVNRSISEAEMSKLAYTF